VPVGLNTMCTFTRMEFTVVDLQYDSVITASWELDPSSL